MSDIELKPCPFCGGKAKCIEYYGLFHVICCDCYIAGRDRPSIDEAIEAWNIRPIEDALQAENERLKKELADLKKEYLLRSDIKKVVDSALEEGIIDFPSLELKED